MAEQLAEVLKNLRESRKLSKSRLARESGVSDPYIVQIEQGQRHPSEDVLRRLAHVLRVPPHALLIPAGVYDAEELHEAEMHAQELVYYATAHGEDVPDDLYDRYLDLELRQIELSNEASGTDTIRSSATYWGWNRPLPATPPEYWGALSDSDRRLVQMLINRLASQPESDE